MQDKQILFGKVFLGVSIVGALFVLTELVLRFFSQSICSALGCQLVSRYARFGDISFLLIGFLIFSLLIACVVKSLNFNKPAFGKYINLILVVSLACEGFFTGFQAFRVHMPCVFCLIISGLLIALGLLRLIQGEKEIIAGFAAMAGVLSLSYLILPVNSSVSIMGQPALPIVGEPLPHFELTLFNGQKVGLKNFQDKSIVINFWNSA